MNTTSHRHSGMPTAKTLSYTVADICADADGVAAAITRDCRLPSGPYRVRGLIQACDRILVQLVPAGKARLETYRFDEACDVSEDELITMLGERWAAGFECAGAVSAGDGLLLLLFAVPEGLA
jgi:hypothetical protein